MYVLQAELIFPWHKPVQCIEHGILFSNFEVGNTIRKILRGPDIRV